MYDPISYWTKRKEPNRYNHVKDIEVQDLKPYVDDAHTILDYGSGIGRLMPLYKYKSVHCVDIVNTYFDECVRAAEVNNVWMTYSDMISGQYDLGVCTKVLLHESDPKDIIDTLADHCDKVFISTAIETDAEHCFTHDYRELLKDYDIELYNQHGNELHIVYADNS